MVSTVSGEKSSMNLNCCCSYWYRASSQSGPEPKYTAELKLFPQEAHGKLLNSELVRQNSQADLLLSSVRNNEFSVAPGRDVPKER